MRFANADLAIAWLDEHPACQKAIYMRSDGTVWIGDIEDAPGKPSDWSMEVSIQELNNFVFAGESDPR